MSKILIIEDEAAIRRVLNKIISEENDSYNVEEAEDGLQGIEMIMNNDYDLVFCDIKMPKNRAWYYNKDDGYLGTDSLKQ